MTCKKCGMPCQGRYCRDCGRDESRPDYKVGSTEGDGDD